MRNETVAQYVCVSCGKPSDRFGREQWYEGSERDVLLEPDETAVEEGAFLCDDCFRRIDPEERPRWKPLKITLRDKGIKG